MEGIKNIFAALRTEDRMKHMEQETSERAGHPQHFLS
jgi:hypothetical protein